MHLQDLLMALAEPPHHIYNNTQLAQVSEVAGLAYDSRKVKPGTLFIAVPGTHTDGRHYVVDAARHGAVAAIGEAPLDEQSLTLPYIKVSDIRSALADLASAFYNTPTQHLCTIGITGTDGKTTTCNLLADLFEQAGYPTGMMTTANFRLNGEAWENSARQSTLEALEIQQFLRRLVDAQGTHAIIETTSHGLELQRVRGCAFDIGIVTNITYEHLDFHKTLDAYRRAKARLFEGLEPTRDKGLGIQPVAILNRDDSSYEFLKPYCKVPILDYGIETEAAICAVDLQLHAHSTTFRLILPDHEGQVETPLVGRFNVSNCLAAVAAAYHQGMTFEQIATGLSNIKGVSGRMERIDEQQPFTVIVDYAHTPDSLEKVLHILRPLTSGKLMVVFGSAGERDVQKRPVMGKIAAQMADFFVITDEDPREEDRETILRDIARGAEAAGKKAGQDFLCIADRAEAISTAFARAQAGDTILLAGKGHEQTMIVGREKIPWDDRRVARDYLRRNAF